MIRDEVIIVDHIYGKGVEEALDTGLQGSPHRQGTAAHKEETYRESRKNTDPHRNLYQVSI